MVIGFVGVSDAPLDTATMPLPYFVYNSEIDSHDLPLPRRSCSSSFHFTEVGRQNRTNHEPQLCTPAISASDKIVVDLIITILILSPS